MRSDARKADTFDRDNLKSLLGVSRREELVDSPHKDLKLIKSHGHGHQATLEDSRNCRSHAVLKKHPKAIRNMTTDARDILNFTNKFRSNDFTAAEKKGKREKRILKKGKKNHAEKNKFLESFLEQTHTLGHRSSRYMHVDESTRNTAAETSCT